MAQKTRDDLLAEARQRGLGEDVVSDDASKAELQDALDKLGPTPGEAAEAAAEETGTADAEERFDSARLIADAEGFFGVAGHVVAGALHDVDGPLTLSEAKAAIDAWSESVVQEVH